MIGYLLNIDGSSSPSLRKLSQNPTQRLDKARFLWARGPLWDESKFVEVSCGKPTSLMSFTLPFELQVLQTTSYSFMQWYTADLPHVWGNYATTGSDILSSSALLLQTSILRNWSVQDAAAEVWQICLKQLNLHLAHTLLPKKYSW